MKNEMCTKCVQKLTFIICGVRISEGVSKGLFEVPDEAIAVAVFPPEMSPTKSWSTIYKMHFKSSSDFH